MNTLIHKPKSYPKNAEKFYPKIQKIEVEEKKSKFYEQNIIQSIINVQ